MTFCISYDILRSRAVHWMRVVLLAAVPVSALVAQNPPPTPPTATASDLSKATQNPVGDLKSIPLQFNFFSGGDLVDRATYNLNFQPVIPVPVGKWNVVLRTIVPYLNIPTTGGRSTGIGDIQQQILLTPAKPGAIIWGLGPVIQLPTATNDLARTGDWAMGPALVIVKDIGPFVIGGLVTQAWTFAGDDIGPNVNQGSIQPFINYNLPDGWAISTSPQIVVNWSAESEDRWSIPLGVGVSKVISLGKQPINTSVQYYNYVQAPPGSGRNVVRFVTSFLFPNRK